MSDNRKEKAGGEEKRSYFRVDDVISVVANPVQTDSEKNAEFLKKVTSSKVFSLMEPFAVSEDRGEKCLPDDTGNSRLYGMMTEINTKLDFIINHFMLDKEGLLTAEKKLVNISASGIRFTVDHPVKINDVMDIKLLLPTYPPVAVLAYGEVKRVKELDDNQFEVSLEYLNMGDSVRNEIVQYTLDHQREIIRKLRESETNE